MAEDRIHQALGLIVEFEEFALRQSDNDRVRIRSEIDRQMLHRRRGRGLPLRPRSAFDERVQAVGRLVNVASAGLEAELTVRPLLTSTISPVFPSWISTSFTEWTTPLLRSLMSPSDVMDHEFLALHGVSPVRWLCV